MQKKGPIKRPGARYPVSHAILHCLAVPGDWYLGKRPEDVVREITAWHRSFGFRAIGYHYVVMPDGEIAIGRPVSQGGAHVSGMNHDTLGIAMVESSTIRGIGTFADYFTSCQHAAVSAILDHHAISRVSGHNDWANKLCPGFKVRTEDFVPWAGTPQAKP